MATSSVPVRRQAACASIVGLAMVTALPAWADSAWSLRLPKEEVVSYRGVVSFDAAGSPGGGFLYPAPNAAGFIAAVITHGLLVESQKNNQKQALQNQADKVLEPYRAHLDRFKHAELMQKALEKTSWGTGRTLTAASGPRGTDWAVESVPAYAMTQDQRALVLENKLTVYRPGEATSPAYQGTIRVVSQPRGDWDPQWFWLERDLAALKEESSSLLAHSLDLALREASHQVATQPAYKTVRYLEGSIEKMERAQVIMDRCSRQVIRTLRGWLMSIPMNSVPDEPAQACQPALPGWQ